MDQNDIRIKTIIHNNLCKIHVVGAFNIPVSDYHDYYFYDKLTESSRFYRVRDEVVWPS